MRILFPAIFVALLLVPQAGLAQEAAATSSEYSTSGEVVLYLFHSESCQHCRDERAFLPTLAEKYPGLVIESYEVSEADYSQKLQEVADAFAMPDRERGLVPLTFVGDAYFVGFDAPETTGRDIERAVRVAFGLEEESEVQAGMLTVPFLGTVSVGSWSLPVLAIVLGILDGINICSVSALFLILAVALTFKSRRKVFLFGGTFLVVTALLYGVLIFIWHELFSFFAPYLGTLKVVIGLLGIGGGLYFLREFYNMRKKGAVCEIMGTTFVERLTARVRVALTEATSLWAALSAVAVFAAVLTIVEFPCSAALPVAFAAVLVEEGVSFNAQLLYIGLFVLFYLLDELILFGIAASRLALWQTSAKLSTWAMGAGGLLLLLLGLGYLLRALGVL